MIDLGTIVGETTRRFVVRHPEQREAYGEVLEAWTQHDLRHILAWTALDLGALEDLDGQLRWLAGVLSARGYSVGNLVESLQLAAQVLDESEVPMHDALSARLRDAARRLEP